MFEMETDPDHIVFLLLEKLCQNQAISVKNWIEMNMSCMVFPNFSQNMNFTGLGYV